MINILRFSIYIFVASITLAGCSESITEKQMNETEIASESLKENLILAVGSEPETGFDPTTGWGRYGSPLFQSTLLKRDNKLKIDYDLATEYEVSEDGLVWSVTLREDALFSDGQAVTAEDVKFTFDRIVESGSILDLSILDRVEVVDTYHVQFHLKQAQSTFIHSLITTGIVPEHAYDENYAVNPIGSGPFTLLQWDKGQQMIIEANNQYYGKIPEFSRVTFLFLNEDAAFAAAQAGQVDMAYIPPAFSKQEIEGMRLEAVQSVDNRGIMFPYVPAGETTEDGVPIGNDVTADRAIRKAINIAIDRQALVDGVLEGYGTPGYSISDGLPWSNPETAINDNDHEGAKRILTEAGWKDQDGDGILEKEGLKAEFTLVYPAGDVTRQSLAIAAADLINPIGINMIVEGKSWDDIELMMHSNAVMLGWGSHDPLEMYNVYSSAYAGVDWYNTGYYSNATVDEYFKKALSATSEEEAITYWQKAQWDGETGFSAHGDAPWAWLVNLDHLYVINEKLDIGEQPIQPHGHGWPITDNLADWTWID